MKIEHELKVTMEIGAGDEEFDYYTPPAGSRIEIIEFIASGAHSQNAACFLVWNYNHEEYPYVHEGEEVVLWSAKGDIVVPGEAFPTIEDCDGVKSLAIVSSNGLEGKVYMSVYCRFVVYGGQ